MLAQANLELEKTSKWFTANKLTLNVKKTKFMIFGDKNVQLEPNRIKIGNQNIDQVGTNCPQKYFKFVGHLLDDKCSWEGHVEHVSKKLASANYAINSTKHFLPITIRKNLYYSLFDCHLNFGNLLWGCANKKLINKLENLQKRCIRNVSLKSFKSHTEPLFKQLSILKFTDKLSYCKSVFMHKYKNEKLPPSFSGIFTDITESDELQTRHNDYNVINLPAIKRPLEKFPYKQIIANWNALEIDIKSVADADEFESLLKEKYLSNYKNDMGCLDKCFSCDAC